jgi:hypothetical protein
MRSVAWQSALRKSSGSSVALPRAKESVVHNPAKPSASTRAAKPMARSKSPSASRAVEWQRCRMPA